MSSTAFISWYLERICLHTAIHTSQVFTEHTHIVAIKATGNVYCWEAVDELNIKAKNWKDLLTDEPMWVWGSVMEWNRKQARVRERFELWAD